MPVSLLAFFMHDVRHSLSDIEKAKRLLRYAPAHNVRDGMTVTVKWFACQLGRELLAASFPSQFMVFRVSPLSALCLPADLFGGLSADMNLASLLVPAGCSQVCAYCR